jgi:hypothetical protein
MLCTAAVVFDQPYGVSDNDWDQQWTLEEFMMLFRQLDAQKGGDKYMIMVYCSDVMIGQTVQALEAHGFSKCETNHWYKCNLNTEGRSLVFAFEHFVVAYRGRRSDFDFKLPTNPLLRHNIMWGPQQRNFHKLSGGKPINPFQKPSYIVNRLLETCLQPGSNVVVIGSGAGGDVEGAVAAGMNVYAFENDPKQYKAVIPIWQKYASDVSASSIKEVFASAWLPVHGGDRCRGYLDPGCTSLFHLF